MSDLECSLPLRVPYKMKRRLKELQKTRGLNISQFVRDAIAEKLNNVHPIKLDEFSAPLEQIEKKTELMRESYRTAILLDWKKLTAQGKPIQEVEQIIKEKYPEVVKRLNSV